MEHGVAQEAQSYFETVYRETFGRVSRHVFFKSPGLQDAEDVTSIVYTDFYRYVVMAGKRPDNALSYLIRMADHELSRLYSKKIVSLSFDDEATGLDETVADERDAEMELFDGFRDEVLWAAVRRLSPGEQRILIGRFRFDMTFPEIAEATGRRESAVKLAFYRSLKKLRADLETRAGI